jgi:hypothetical protein
MPTARARALIRTAWTSALWTAVSVWLVNPYRYVDGDQAITIPFAKRLVDPSLYPGDYLLEQQRYYLTYLWHLAAELAAVIGLPGAFFVLYVVALFATFAAARSVALALFDREDVALLTQLMLLFPTSMPADVRPLDPLLLTRSAARPLVLFGVAAVLRRRPVPAAVLLGLGLLVHPMSATQAVLLLLPSTALLAREAGWRRLAIGAAAFVVLAVPLLVWRHEAGPGAPLWTVDPHWLQLLRLRSWWHIFPSTWPDRVAAIAFGVGLFAFARRYGPQGYPREVVLRMVGAAVALWAIGTFFVEVVPVASVLQAQLFRSSAIVWFVIVPHLAHALVHLVHGEHKPMWTSASRTTYLAPLLLAWPLLPTHWYVLVALAVGTVVQRWRPQSPLRWAGGVCALAVALGIPFRRTPSAPDPDFEDAQAWIRQHTAVDALVIVPPETSAFRVSAERTVYVDYKDGTLTNFNPQFAFEWERRMLALVGPFQDACMDPKACNGHLADRYDAVSRDTLDAIAAEETGHGSVYVVLRTTADGLGYDEVHRNATYSIVRVR